MQLRWPKCGWNNPGILTVYTFWNGWELKKLKWIKIKKSHSQWIADIGDIEELSQIQSLWNELLVVNNCLSARPEEIINAPIQMLELEARICQFFSAYPVKHSTPYMHCMMHHISEFTPLCSPILLVTQQEMESIMRKWLKTTFIWLAIVSIIYRNQQSNRQ